MTYPNFGVILNPYHIPIFDEVERNDHKMAFYFGVHPTSQLDTTPPSFGLSRKIPYSIYIQFILGSYIGIR